MDKERQHFEAWMRAYFPSADLSRGASGEYVVWRIEMRWHGWKARAKRDAKTMPAGQLARR